MPGEGGIERERVRGRDYIVEFIVLNVVMFSKVYSFVKTYQSNSMKKKNTQENLGSIYSTLVLFLSFPDTDRHLVLVNELMKAWCAFGPQFGIALR